MNKEEYISERIRATKREREERMEVEYVEIKLPNNVISKTITNGTVKTIKQSKRRVETVPPEPKEGGGGNGKKFAERKKNAPIKKMINSNKKITEMHTKVSPRRYYVMMMLGLVTAIIGGVMSFVTKDLIYVLIIISGVGIFLMESIDFKEAKEMEKRFKAVD
jgi:hypothetical protein